MISLTLVEEWRITPIVYFLAEGTTSPQLHPEHHFHNIFNVLKHPTQTSR